MAPDECFELLERVHFGRIAFAEGDRTVVLPVNYLFHPPDVVFRSTVGSKLDVATAGRPVAFEIDATDPLYQGGWSVLAHGHAEVVSDPAEVARLENLPVRSWWQPARDRWIRIRVTEVTGRRLRQPPR
jgi:nitroimidazol reductase NimA-like FMN-containing flavoprotein (pyridoxamine 5'-phosphate oxidase superfamily)